VGSPISESDGLEFQANSFYAPNLIVFGDILGTEDSLRGSPETGKSFFKFQTEVPMLRKNLGFLGRMESNRTLHRNNRAAFAGSHGRKK